MYFDIEQIKSRLKIWDALQRMGCDVKTRCGAIKSPFRDDRSPSFSIFADGERCKDHSTGESWDVISLVEAYRGVDSKEAIEICAGWAGVAEEDTSTYGRSMHIPQPPKSKANNNKGDAKAPDWKASFPPPTGQSLCNLRKQAQIELSARNLPLYIFAKLKGLTNETMIKAINIGLIGSHKKSATESMITWHFLGVNGETGIKVRTTPQSSRKTFWLHGKASNFLFGDVLFNRKSFSDENRLPLFVVEGESDVLAMLQLGFPAVGITGAATIPDPILTHRIFSHRQVTLLFDNDDAGVKGSLKFMANILKEATDCNVTNLTGNDFMSIPKGCDIGNVVEQGGKVLQKVKEELTAQFQSMNSRTK